MGNEESKEGKMELRNIKQEEMKGEEASHERII